VKTLKEMKNDYEEMKNDCEEMKNDYEIKNDCKRNDRLPR